eukprot:TRINITY_DN2253_c0_g1_i1.p1 TRINITY_DN2253_c0_g1~~TRINITY_DN2253_c0_g1_i1.p1  ORF type:complete len:165 (+),score=3.66 TRINITY_DN2253_c0_g1_i1:795-1289(+)
MPTVAHIFTTVHDEGRYGMEMMGLHAFPLPTAWSTSALGLTIACMLLFMSDTCSELSLQSESCHRLGCPSDSAHCAAQFTWGQLSKGARLTLQDAHLSPKGWSATAQCVSTQFLLSCLPALCKRALLSAQLLLGISAQPLSASASHWCSAIAVRLSWVAARVTV